jgi:hypothetical protein
LIIDECGDERFVAAVVAIAVVVLSLGLIRVNPWLTVCFNLIATGGLVCARRRDRRGWRWWC